MAQLPYPPRPGQEELVATIQRTQAEGGHLVAEAGTGTGKTITALTASLTTTKTDHRRLVYATRTNAQQTQVVREHAALVAFGQDAGLLVPFMGRRQYCPLLRSDERFAEGTAEELGRLCRDAKRKAQQQNDTGKPVEGACPFYARLLQDGPDPVEALLRGGGLDGAQLAARVESAGSCPYEALKMLLPKADVIVIPAIFLIDDRLRRALQQWFGTGLDECHLVVDEAHHLPQAAREHHSPALSSAALIRAQKEAEEYHDPVLAGSHLTTTVLDALLRALHSLADEFVRDGEDGLVPPGALTEALLGQLRVASPTIARIASDLAAWGENVREDKRSKGRLPRSHLGAVGAFLQNWLAIQDAPYVHLATGGDNPALELFLLDPAPVLGWLGEFWSTTHMSGTLAPLSEHAELCGLAPDRTATKRFPSPFNPANLRLAALEGVHRRYEALQRDPTGTERQQAAAREALALMPGRTGLFFPSHRMLRDYLEEGFLHDLGRPQHVERAEMDNAELGRLVDAFRRDSRPGALLLGVLGGRLTEGLDFPGDAMEHMLLFGIPYPRPSARSQALIHHYDAKAGNGWMVAVHNPVGRTLRQAVGRLIRGPDDRGTALILDERAVRFHDHLPDLRMLRQVSELGPSGDEPPGDSDDLDRRWSAEKGYCAAADLPRRSSPDG
ncbi:MAG: ATP-dependent DNA helicase [Candidatus Thermoplasmatota archaeon]